MRLRPPRLLGTAAAAALVVAGASLPGPAAAAPDDSLPATDRIELYEVTGDPGLGTQLSQQGFDVTFRDVADGTERVDLALDRRDLAKARGVGLEPKPVRNPDGQTNLQSAAAQSAGGYEVWRSYSEPGGIADQMRTIAAEHPDITKLVEIGETHQGQPILAMKVTASARRVADGTRPAVLYSATQHAREWISTEVDMRLLEYITDGYDSDAELRRLVTSRELWFVPVANPDGYDFTFTPGNRLWRKNLRDNNGDGQITTGDGVDLNRNFSTNWNYDEEGSSSEPSSSTYRGPSAGSEPETQAMDGLLERIGFAFQVNYHSYGPLLLYPAGWQVQTETADDPIYEALSGDDAEPAIEGFDPDLSAELYTTNGETTDHAHATYGTLAWTPELDPGCDGCGFVFPDDEELVQAEFEKNLPFALDVARSAQHPDQPTSHLGNTTPDFEVDAFPVSHGTSQPVQVNAKRRLGPVEMRYSVNGGPSVTVPTTEWAGGERFGKDYDVYYHRMRGAVTGTQPGDEVTVTFHAPQKGVSSEPFTYRVADDIGGDVLVLAAEDVTGVSPAQGVTTAKYADDYAAALDDAGYSSDVYDVDANDRMAPDPLGVLSHYDAVVWETGDDVITRAPGQPAGTAAKLANDLELAARAYLNEGGKLIYTGQYAGLASGSDGSFWYEPEVPAAPECTTRQDPPCLPLSNDFLQYYLGAYTYNDDAGTADDGTAYPLRGDATPYTGFTGTLNGGDSADNQGHTASFLTTSSFLPADTHPQFGSSAPLQWERPGGAPYDPHTGDWMVFSDRADQSYKRLTTTVDLTGRSDGTLSFWTSHDTESDWDYMFVEAHTVGDDGDWTTLPDANGHTSQDTGDSCAYGWSEIHPFIGHYQSPDCSPTGTSGEWHAATGNSAGWQEWSVDLSAWAGKQVEVSISYASDWGTQGLGVFLDDATVTAGGSVLSQTSFEDGLGGWTVSGPPQGSQNANDWTRGQKAFEEGAGVVTDDTVFVGFGAEGLTTADQRSDFLRRSLEHLLG